ncbi:MAG: NADAR family protein [Caldilineaceae bacterium]|nr:NADAR family protein [Caldilineaceae bacterium]MBP8106526.1 NADAR family protein [Caldilineaceae bacterium]MBP8121548.1 NADAR family protein [Caldilineaceae bacterium]MBP9071417.1 NADAR family protein [Caldilineaceae bacterium]
MTIRFYRVRDPNGELSNHSAHGFELDGLFWPTIEHYYQAQKFAGTPHAETIRQAPRPMDAKRLGQTTDFPLRADWEEVKEAILLRATLAKYETHADVRAVLLTTGDEELVEASPTDYYWGCGANGTGLNRYGHVLMQVRALLRENYADA